MDRVVVVTGASTGIGRAVATRFAADGARVLVTGRRMDKLAAVASGIGATAVSFDVTDPAAVECALADLPERIDVLVNNAGGNTDLGRSGLAGLSDLAAAWVDNLAANLLGAVLVTAAVSDRLAAGGSVVQIGSIAGARGSGGGGYGPAKAAVAAWNLDLSAELGPRGITANLVAPGFVDNTGFFQGRLTDERRARLVAETRNQQAGTPEDIAEAVLFLASPGARHITGQVLHVNGGALTTR
jgi:3-oxoacyl-[acyl-carrier protein] reductase